MFPQQRCACSDVHSLVMVLGEGLPGGQVGGLRETRHVERMCRVRVLQSSQKSRVPNQRPYSWKLGELSTYLVKG